MPHAADIIFLDHDSGAMGGADAVFRVDGTVTRRHGLGHVAFAGAAKTYHAEFRSDYGYHAQMEPLNAVAR